MICFFCETVALQTHQSFSMGSPNMRMAKNRKKLSHTASQVRKVEKQSRSRGLKNLAFHIFPNIKIRNTFKPYFVRTQIDMSVPTRPRVDMVVRMTPSTRNMARGGLEPIILRSKRDVFDTAFYFVLFALFVGTYLVALCVAPRNFFAKMKSPFCSSQFFLALRHLFRSWKR